MSSKLCLVLITEALCFPPSLSSSCGKVELSEPFPGSCSPGSVGWLRESCGRTGCFSSSTYLCQNFKFPWKCPEPRCRIQLQCTVAIRISVFLWFVMGVFFILKERQAWVLSGWNNLAWTVWVLDGLFSWPFGQDRVFIYTPVVGRPFPALAGMMADELSKPLCALAALIA